jgi:nucleoside phosphorylase
VSAPPDRAPIAVICAVPEELTHLRAALPPGREVHNGTRAAWITDLNGHPIVLALCGIGMLSAAAVAEAVITQHRPTAVLNFGCAGAHRRELLPGDLVIGDRVVAYDNVREDQDGGEHFANMHYLAGSEQRKAAFLPTDERLFERALRVAATLEGQHEPWPTTLRWPDGVPHRAPDVIVGTVASADRWNRTPARIGALVRQHDTVCEDMEAAALALTCASHGVPFLTVKDISNNELLAMTELDHAFLEEFGEQIGRRAAALILALLHDLVATPGL